MRYKAWFFRLKFKFFLEWSLLGLFLVFYLLWASGLIPLVQFPRERIEVTLLPEMLEVNGLYTYTNPWPLPLLQGLKTPFPVDKNHPRPATVSVSQVIAQEEIPLQTHWFQSEPYFTIHLPAYSEVQIRVRYRQMAMGNTGQYILTTTHAWGKPLRYGEYLVYPQGVKLKYSNYALQGLRFQRQGFMPQKDWHLVWEKI